MHSRRFPPLYLARVRICRHGKVAAQRFGETRTCRLKSGGIGRSRTGRLFWTGCQSSRISGIDTGGPDRSLRPLLPEMSSRASCRLRHRPAPVVATAPTDPSQFPAAPTTPGVAAPAAAHASCRCQRPDVTVGSVAGVWNVSTGGGVLQGCDAADQIWPRFPRRPAEMPGRHGQCEIVERRRQAAGVL